MTSRSLSTALSVTIAALTVAASAGASPAVLKRQAPLRKDPSAKHQPVDSLEAGEDVDVIDANPKNGYYHVRSADGEVGWVYGKSLDVGAVPAPQTVTPHQPVTSGGADAGGIATSIPTVWEKPAPVADTVQEADGDCGPTGDGGDQVTNLRKNRTDVPATYHPVAWQAVQALPYPVAGRSLDKWTKDQLAQIQPYEGVAVSVIGYVAKIKVEGGGKGEATNCHFVEPDEVDWHMPFVEHSGGGEDTSIVVETTPRIRVAHPKWTPSNLAPWVSSQAPVRISGWVLLDPEHRAHLGKYRSTLWEIHPITKIEVFEDGQWVDVDSLP